MINSKKKLLKPIFFIVSAILLALAGFFILQPKIIEFTLKRTPLPEPEKPIELIFVGDIMLDRGVKYMVEKHGDNDFSFPFAKIADEIKNADLAMANLESQISNKGSNSGSIYSFRAPVEAIQGTLNGPPILGTIGGILSGTVHTVGSTLGGVLQIAKSVVPLATSLVPFLPWVL